MSKTASDRASSPLVSEWRRKAAERDALQLQAASREYAMYAKRLARNANMSGVYKWETFVNAELNKMAQHRPGVRVYWPTGMRGESTALSTYDASYFKHMMADERVNQIIIPENSGGHWTLTMMRRDPTTNNWSSYHVSTRADGTCGDSLVEEAKALTAVSASDWETEVKQRHAKVGAGHVRPAHPTAMEGVRLPVVVKPIVAASVERVSSADVTTAPSLPASVSSSVAAAEASEMHQATMASVMSASVDELSAVEYNLSCMADAEYAGNDDLLQYHQEKLVDAINSSDDKDRDIDRLLSLAGKESIDEVIRAVTSSAAALR